MNEQEVISRLKEHLQYCFNKDKETITKRDRAECIKMIMDFFPHMKKNDAEIFFRDNIIKDLKLISNEFAGVTYTSDGIATNIVSSADGQNINIYKENIKEFATELLKLVKAYENLGVA